MSEQERVSLITDLLLGAAHADGRMDGKEAEAVKGLVAQLTSDPGVLARTETRLTEFSPEGFDVTAAAQFFVGDGDDQKRNLLELVAKVSEADDELAVEEDSYLKALASALGLSADHYSDLTLDYTVEEAQEAFQVLLDEPPPVP